MLVYFSSFLLSLLLLFYLFIYLFIYFLLLLWSFGLCLFLKCIISSKWSVFLSKKRLNFRFPVDDNKFNPFLSKQNLSLSLSFLTQDLSCIFSTKKNNELTVITKSIFLTGLPILPFPVTDGKFYLETPFLALSETHIWRLLPVTYNGYGCQHQKYSAEKLLIHCLSPEMKANTKCLPCFSLFSITMI